MAEKNIFAYKLFLSLNISDFNLFFYVKIATPLKKRKKSPPFPPFSQSCQAPPTLFENLVGGSTPPCRNGASAHYAYLKKKGNADSFAAKDRNQP